jgi:hypothetical protein
MTITVTASKGPGSQRLEQLIKDLSKIELSVGWFASSKYTDGTSVAEAAATAEYGNPARRIPPRPIFGPTIINNEPKWKNQIGSGVKAILAGNETGESVLNKMGSGIVGDVKETIQSIFAPPLAQSTIYARLHRKSDKKTIGLLTKPLIDTGLMFNSVSHVVEREK